MSGVMRHECITVRSNRAAAVLSESLLALPIQSESRPPLIFGHAPQRESRQLHSCL